MKTCACCGTRSEALTCPSCGEASWLPAEREPEKKPKTESKPTKR